MLMSNFCPTAWSFAIRTLMATVAKRNPVCSFIQSVCVV